MNSRDFCFWLQGVFEINDPGTLDAEQVAIIKQHLALVFKHDIGTDGKCDHPLPISAAIKFPQTLVGPTPDPNTILIC